MIETDVPVCVLICLDVYVGFQDLKLVKNKQKLADFVPLKFWKFNSVVLILCWDISNDFLMSYPQGRNFRRKKISRISQILPPPIQTPENSILLS